MCPFAQEDVPKGYTLDDTDKGAGDGNGTSSSDTPPASSPGTTDDDDKSSSSLSTGTIVGIAMTVAVAGIIGTIFKWLSYRHKKKHTTTEDGGNNGQLVRHRPAWEGMPPGALTGDAEAQAKYTWRHTSFPGYSRTTETFKIARQPTPPAAAVFGRGRVLGEV